MVEGWLPPADDESPGPSAQDTSESPPAKGNEDDEDESEEEIAPLVRKTRGQRQREIEASRSLERHDDDDELPETTSRRQATPSKKKNKEKEARAPPRRKTKPPKMASPPHSTSISDAHSSADDGAAPATTALDAPSVEVPLASMPPPFAPVSGLGKAPAAATSPHKEVPIGAASPRKEAPAVAASVREEAPAEGIPDAPAAASTTKKPSVSWARDVLELGLSRQLGPELEKPAGLRTGLRFIPVAK